MADQDEAKQNETPEEAEPKKGEGTEEKPAEAQGGEDVKDSHGQPGINREKYQRDLKAKEDEIAELRKQLDEKSKTEEGRAELQKQIDELKAKAADDATTYALKDAGCNAKAIKAAKALLPDYEGDVDKLKAECPFLFSEEKKTGTTGLKPEGAADGIDEKLDRAFGIAKK